MDLTFPVQLSSSSSSSSSISAHRRHRCLLFLRPFFPNSSSSTTRPPRKSPALVRATTTTATDNRVEVEQKKHELLRAVQDTQRGLATTADQRSAIEEALVSVEGYDAGSPVDLARLDGTWRLNYTSASDVLLLFEAAQRIPFLQVGQIFQKFECKDRSQGGIVRNVVRWSIQDLLEEQEGATLLVSAKFSLLSNRNIYLQFEEILQFIRTFRAQVPVSGAESSCLSSPTAAVPDSDSDLDSVIAARRSHRFGNAITVSDVRLDLTDHPNVSFTLFASTFAALDIESNTHLILFQKFQV